MIRKAVAVTARVGGPGFVELYERTVTDVHSYLASRVGDRAVAEDLTQDVFVVGARRCATGEVVDVAWLIGVARHELVDHWRGLAREDRKLSLAHSSELTRRVEEPASIDAGLVEVVLAGLNPTYRAALVLRHVDGLSVAAVADHLDRTVDATEQVLSRARAAFRDRYIKDQPMSDDVDLRGIDQRHEPDPHFRAALRRRVAAIVAGRDPSQSLIHAWEVTTIDLEPTHGSATPRPPNGRVARVIVAVASAAAIIAAIALIISGDDENAPADTPLPSVTAATPSASAVETTDVAPTGLDLGPVSPLEEPSQAEVAQADRDTTYHTGTGHTEVTAARTYVSLRRCRPELAYEPCEGTDGWAYVTGPADRPEAYYGLLGIADDLTLSALDDRFFVAAASSSSSQDPASAPPAWLIDSVTGQRGALKWQDGPTTLNSAQQALALFPGHPNPYYAPYVAFLPRVVDMRDWTIAPLTVPADASGALLIPQSGSDRIWIGTAPDGGHVGLAYTDDGGASWTDVELPPAMRTTSEALLQAAALPWPGELLRVTATGDHVAVTTAWGSDSDTKILVSADAGENWKTVLLVPTGSENGRELFVLPDDRLMVVTTIDPYAQRLFVSRSASDWSQLEKSTYAAPMHSHVDVNQRGIVINYTSQVNPRVSFSTELTNWWTIPGIPNFTAG